jgi:prepilin signal peptidase PulO-like enzyme (type II secretory pathway)
MTEPMPRTSLPLVTSGPAEAVEVRPSPVVARIPWAAFWAALLALAATISLAVPLLFPHVSPVGLFPLTLIFLLCLLAAWFDAATGRIPNPLTYTAILVGLAINFLPVIFRAVGVGQGEFFAATTPMDALEGFGFCAAVGLGSLIFAGMGGGDMKLMVAIGASLGFHGGGVVLLWALAVALPYAVVNLLLAGRLNLVLRLASVHVLSWIYLREGSPIEPVSKSSVPLAVPLLAGLILARAFPGVML